MHTKKDYRSVLDNSLPLLLFFLLFLINTYRAQSAEFVIINGEITYNSGSNAFSRTIKDYSKYPSNWLYPNDYYHGTIYAYFKVISVPTSIPFGMQVCFFQYYPSKAAFDGVNYNEVCSPVSTLRGVNSEAYFSGTPNNWWKMGGRDVDFSRVYDFESVGPVIWGTNPSAPLIFKNGGGNDATWAQRANWLPCTIRVIIVAVSSGSTFSGWSNYLSGSTDIPATPENPKETIYPNPFYDELTLSNNSYAYVQLIDVQGNIRMEIAHPTEDLVHINTQNLNQGMYIIRTIKNDGTIQTSKIIKSGRR